MRRRLSLFIICLAAISCHASDNINLSGRWQFSFTGKDYSAFISLPGTTDTNGLGNGPVKMDETTHLTRLHSYVGRAWYRRTVDIPKDWKKKDVYLHMERTKATTVWVDGDSIASNNDISTPQVYKLGKLKPGKHVLTVRVDNGGGVPPQVITSSHAYSEDTQTNWNGIIGKIYIEGPSPTLSPTPTPPPNGEGKDYAKQQSVGANASAGHINPLPIWGRGRGGASRAPRFEIRGQHFYADGHRIFLRGKHDACVWPLTGHVPMDVDSWLWYFGKCADYGINHVRFHSWCPPEAAFVAADSLGIYLQPELPFWGDFNEKDTTLMTFLHKEGVNILKTYGHHPSFVMMALGNELWGSIDMMRKFVADFRKIAPDKYYTFGSNYYLGYQGVKPGMDYFTTCRVGGEGWGNYGTHTRGSFSFADAADGGMINHFYPSTDRDFTEACLLAKDTARQQPVPVISHETAQFQTYPDYDEIGKYTGVLYPYNFEVFRHRLASAGMADEAKAFHVASGKWSAQLYKADIEMDLRTGNMAGFQLLDLQDYPGQGTALVGVLDAFMDSKGVISRDEWRQFCSPVVPLAVMRQYTYNGGEPLPLKVQIANYGGSSLKGATVKATLTSADGSDFISPRTYNISVDDEGLITVADDRISLPSVDKAQRLTLTLSLTDAGTNAVNTWPLWVYPAKDDVAAQKDNIIETKTLTDDIARQLENGASVLWTPDSATLAGNTVGGLFQTDYWNWRMFKTISEKNGKTVSPGTMGILTDHCHPLFNSFPTDDWQSWQWFPIVKNGSPLILDNMPAGYKPIVQVIDNVERNHKLGLVMEFAVGKGKLLVCMTDLAKIQAYPEGKAFYNSIVRYMTSDKFQPQCNITVGELMHDITSKTSEGKIDKLDNISQY